MNPTDLFNNFLREQKLILEEYQRMQRSLANDQAALTRLLLEAQRGEIIFDQGVIKNSLANTYTSQGGVGVIVMNIRDARRVRVVWAGTVDTNPDVPISILGFFSNDRKDAVAYSEFSQLSKTVYGSTPGGLAGTVQGDITDPTAINLAVNLLGSTSVFFETEIDMPCLAANYLHMLLPQGGNNTTAALSQYGFYQLFK